MSLFSIPISTSSLLPWGREELALALPLMGEAFLRWAQAPPGSSELGALLLDLAASLGAYFPTFHALFQCPHGNSVKWRLPSLLFCR